MNIDDTTISEAEMKRQLEDMKERGNKITNESLDSTRRILVIAEETHGIGTKTLETLNTQGEQIDRIEQNMEQINADMHEAEKNLTNLEKCCGLCVCPWKRTENFEKSKDFKRVWGPQNDEVINYQPVLQSTLTYRNTSPNKFMLQNGNYIQRVTNDIREDEMDSNLRQVGGLVSDLKSMAVDMGKELDKQNKQLFAMSEKVDMTSDRVDGANVRAKRILRNQ
ncbi:Synaptosomal-associated protein 23 [Trichoplax sp. H2]|nr:Synaptosomal-associated protein 23 [Trichoplax sp. H2]|eukprot:RDD44988.1 Synaptosomal-associated protein 23 [Trichoplax sp. H2]